MQILRMILMVCFVITVYPSIGEAVDMDEGSKIKSTLKATTSSPSLVNGTNSERSQYEEDAASLTPLYIDPNTEQIKTAPDAGENSKWFVKEGGVEYEMPEREVVEPLHEKEAPSVSESTHLNERILQLQKKELDKSLDTPTEDDGY